MNEIFLRNRRGALCAQEREKREIKIFASRPRVAIYEKI
jgi:hypothetical protein